ncbi:MAG: hypothetical protein A2W18_01885, partial [Candidatus Muproteobacteria bacterium RBG_16_60_9]
ARSQATEATVTNLLGTLPYIAPEQTGRMNRAVDYRADYYSLGATLYELFTGQVPFPGTDTLELIHAHIARAPTPPHEIAPQVPRAVSNIILKLLAKTSEDRYQSTWSLEADLERCLTQWQAHGAIETFGIDRLQIRDRFQLSQRLYGRDQDLQTMRAAFDSAASGKPQAVFVTGPAGIGKTSLVREIHQAIAAKHGILVSGNFDPSRRDVPYSALLDALRELVRQLLGADENRIAEWRQALQQALGPNARVLVELVPDLELIVGETPAVPVVGTSETETRLVDIMRRFFRAVCRPQHPLVLFIDNLRHADAASAAMLQHLLTDAKLSSFLFVGCVRDNELDAAHPIVHLRTQLAQGRVAQTELKLSPLAPQDIARLVGDMLGLAPNSVDELATAVHTKTGGNPQFVAQFLTSLHTQGILRFDNSERRWCWDIALIRSQPVTDNVVEQMIASLQHLDEALRRRLQLAACIGTRFDVGMLATIATESAPQLFAGLQAAVTAGMIVPEGGQLLRLNADAAVGAARFHFVHDRLQRALYAPLPEAERDKIHHRIGKQLLAKLADNASSEELFEAVNHLNRGRATASQTERAELARLNLRAGTQAKTAAVSDAALAYFMAGVELLGNRGWDEHYELMLVLHGAVAAVAPLCDQYPELERCFAAVRMHGRSALDKIPVYETKLAIDIRRMDTNAATETGLEALRVLGVRMPSKPSKLDLIYYTTRAKLALWGRSPESLLDHPRMTDPARIAESRLLVRLCQLFYRTNRALLILALYRFVYICVKYGNSEAAPTVYSNYAMTLCAGKDVDKGHRFGRLALALLDKYDAKDQRPWVTAMVHGHIEHWKEHARRSLPPLLECHRQAMALGHMPAAGVALVYHGFMSYHVGEPLPLLVTLLQSHIDTLTKTVKDKQNARILSLYRDVANYFMGSADSEGWYTTNDEASEIYVKTEKGQPFTFHFFRGLLAFHFGDYQRAYQYFQRAVRHSHTIIGVMRYGDLYDGLSRIMMHAQFPKEKQKKNRESILRIKARLKIFAKDSPDNYLHRWHLLEAEFARIEGHALTAMERYDQAIDTARLTGHVHEEALANELAGRFYLGAGKTKIAQTYMNEARALYGRWGAIKKVQWLDATYPQFHMAATSRRDGSIDGTSHSRTISADGFDLPALMKALKTIAEQTVHSQILHETIQVVMQFAGAERALLLLRNSTDVLMIEADADTTRAEPELMKSIPIEESDRLCRAVANYARRTKTAVVIHDATEPQSLLPGLANDPYVRDHGTKSILCIPVTTGANRDAELIGLLYVENNSSSHAFTEQRVETLELICLSVAGRLELSRKAVTDSLTGLYNRGYFQSSLTKEFSAARRKERPLSLVLVDIDFFKKINDNFGHQVGDAVLKHVAKILKSGCRDSDVVARYGGEEMVLILPETNLDHALEVAERIRRALAEQSYSDDSVNVPATASFGVATLNAQRDSAEALIKAADEALYRSKKEGRNRVTAA